MKQFRIAAAAVAVAALALPAVASGDGSVFEITAKVAVPGTDPVQLADQKQYVVTNHGFTFVLREDNGQATTRGMINYKVLPDAYRDGLTVTEILAEGDTGAQPHATCLNSPSLDTEANVLGWQDADPFYNYVPFQAAPAGLADDPARWLEVIEDATDVDRSELVNATSAEAACTRIGGTYHAADFTLTAAASLARGTIAEEKAPLEGQVAALTTAKSKAEAEKAPLEAKVAALTTAKAKAEAEKAAADRVRASALAQLAAANTALAGSRSDAEKYLLAAAPVALDVFASTKASVVARRGASVSVTGPALRPATVQLQVSRKRAKAMALSSRVLARKVTTIGAGGSTTVVIKPDRQVAKALRKLKGSLKVSVSAVSSSRDSATTTFTR